MLLLGASVGVLANGATATLQITATVNGTNPATNTASRLASTPVDPVAANDSTSSTVTGSTVPGLPNNGVPPLEGVWPMMGAVLIGILVTAAGLRFSVPRR